MDWPQNFMLAGSGKTRPIYDALTVSQWVSGFFRCIQETRREVSGNQGFYVGLLC